MIVGLVAVALGALFFGTAAYAVPGIEPDTNSQLPSVALLFALLAIRFNWARITITVVLALLVLLWFPAIAAVGSDDQELFTVGTYVVIAVVTSVTGIVLLYQPRSNDFYRAVATWRAHRRALRSAARHPPR